MAELSPLLADMPQVMGSTNPYSHPMEPIDPVSQNVIDRYKGMAAAAIKDDLDTRRGQMVSVFQNLGSDFNKATALRTHNAMGGKLVVFTGKRKVDRRGMVGQHHYTHATHGEDALEVVRALQQDGYFVMGVDNQPEWDPKPIQKWEFPLKTAFVYGEEKLGLPDEVLEACDGTLYIPMAGSVRSLNVASCAAMVMYAYQLQHPNI